MFYTQHVTGTFVNHVDDKSSLVHLKLRSNFLERKYVCHVALIKNEIL